MLRTLTRRDEIQLQLGVEYVTFIVCQMYLCFRSSRCFLASVLLSDFWVINETLKEIKSLIKRRFSFCRFIYPFLCKFAWYHFFFFFFWLVYFVLTKATSSKPTIAVLLTTAKLFCKVSTTPNIRRHDSRASLEKTIMSPLLAVFAFQLTEVTPPFETRKLRLIIDNRKSHSFSRM